MASPLPLYIQTLSGLDFPWAFFNPDGTSTSTSHLGPDGVTTVEVMQIYWSDLLAACQQLLGYSYRDTTAMTPAVGAYPGGPWLRRKLPWQHPYFNQLYVKGISSVKGLRMTGTNDDAANAFNTSVRAANVGIDAPANIGPWTEYERALLTIEFWRPPYYVRSDRDILDNSGSPQEWLRFVDKTWEVQTQMLSQEGCQYNWAPGQSSVGPPASGPGSTSPGPPGAVGRPITHQKLKKTWYQVPEACIFAPLTAEPAPLNGDPYNLLYMQTTTTNPVTGYVIAPSYTVGNAAYHSYPILGCVNSPSDGSCNDTDEAKRFFGCPMGTLRLDGVEIRPRELQLPPYLMQIPNFSGNEAISQQQYDVTFYFDKFDPMRSSLVAESTTVVAWALAANPAATFPTISSAYRGHNIFPWAGDGMFYAIMSQNNVQGTTSKASPFQYAVFQDMFRSL